MNQLYNPCRQKALKALNERMSKLEQPVNWPSMEEPASPGDENMANGEAIMEEGNVTKEQDGGERDDKENDVELA